MDEKDLNLPAAAVSRPPCEIRNPARLGFRVDETAWREETKIYDNGKDTAAIPLRVIFQDDLKRTLWLAIKQRHITSQYFHHDITRAADSIRNSPPRDPADLHWRISCMTGEHGRVQPDRFCEELFPYVLSVLHSGTLRLEYTEPPRQGASADATPQAEKEIL